MSDRLGPPASRRAATIVAISFAAVLCVVALALAVRSLTAIGEDVDLEAAPPSVPPSLAGSTPAAPVEGTGSAAPEPVAEPTESTTDDRVAFSSPSGNIGCVLGSAGARCDIADRAWEPPARPEGCSEDWGQGLVLGADGVQFVCASDSTLGAAQQLGYGEELTRGEYTCRSEREGMRCTGPGGGFVLARASYEVL